MIEIKTKIETIKKLAADHRKQNNEMTVLAKAADVHRLISNLADVDNITNNLIAKLSYKEDPNNKKLSLQRSEKLDATTLEKFSGQGENRFLKYYQFQQEFSEMVITKELPVSTTVKSSVRGKLV